MAKETKEKPFKKKGNKIAITEAERKRRSERMKELHKQGKAGGQFGKLGGRPRKPRASELIAEEASRHRSEIAAVLREAIAPDMPMSTRLKAVDKYTATEAQERAMEMQEEEHHAKMSKGELIDEMASKLRDNPLLMEMLTKRMESGPPEEPEAEVVDAEVVDDD